MLQPPRMFRTILDLLIFDQNSNPWFSNKKSLTLFKLRVTFISNFLPTIKVVRRKKAFAL